MTETKYLIIGAGAASSWAIRGIRQADKEGGITLVGNEPYRTYSLPLLSKGFIQGRYPEEKIYLVKEDFYEKNGVNFISTKTVTSLDTENNTAVLDDGQEITYEKLLICTGGSALRFQIPGSDLRRIYYLRTMNDAKFIKNAAVSAKEAVVVGGGFIGVELAAALREIGLNVKLIMLEDYVWQNLLPESVGMYLMDLLRENGVQIFPGHKAVEFTGDGTIAEALVTEDGSIFVGDLFGIGIGIRTNKDFFSGSGIKTNRGIIVNDNLETNITGVYAAGDVAEYPDTLIDETHLSGHIENAQMQGRTAGKNMAGADEKYSQITGYDTEIFSTSLMFIGAPEYGTDYIIRDIDGQPGVTLSHKEGKLCGALLIKPSGKDMRAVREMMSTKDLNILDHQMELSDPGGDLFTFVKGLKESE